jgi:hypothetical protein
MKRIICTAAILLVLTVQLAAAEVPPKLNYQGVLTDGTGTALPGGDYQITFKIYTQSSGGSDIWFETRTVTVTGGIFNVIIGDSKTLDLPFDVPYWLGVTVGTDPEMEPRRQLTAVPYSMTSANVRGTTNVFPADGKVGIGTAFADEKLHVIGNGRFELGTGVFDISTPGGNPGIIAIGPGGNRRDLVFTTEGLYIATSASNAAPSANNGVRILENGNVGLGRNPGQRLDVGGGIRFGNTTAGLDGTIRWTGTDFEGFDGSVWKSLTSGGGGGLPPGSPDYTLRHTGTEWVADGNLFNNGTNVGIGTFNPDPAHKLHVYGLARFDLPSGQVNISTPGGNPGVITFAPNGNRRDIVVDVNGIWIAANSTPSAPSATNGLVLRENGRVGLGTADPTNRLHVAGTGRFDVGDTHISINESSGSPNIYGFGPNGHRRDILFSDHGISIFSSPWNTGGGVSRGITIDEEGNVQIGSGTHPTEYGLNVNRVATGSTVALGGHVGPGPTVAPTFDAGVYGEFLATSELGYGVYGEAHSDNGAHAGVYGKATGTNGFGVYSDGDMGTSGTKAAVVATADYGTRRLFCLESPGVYFEDFGQGQLVNGEATVTIDPMFAQTVNLDMTYHVFLTPMGECPLYVARKSPTSFTVHAMGEGNPDVSFDYRIVAKRLGYENLRLDRVSVVNIGG